MMNSFYFWLWLKWSLRVTICSVVMASILSSFVTLFLYLNQTTIPFDNTVLYALVDIFLFWFALFFSVTLLLALFRSIKYIFNVCIQGYTLKLLSCNTQDIIDIIGYGDLVKVWRKWFMLLIWLVATMMIVALVVSTTFEWFNIYWLYAFVMLSGYISFIFMIARCKRIELVKC